MPDSVPDISQFIETVGALGLDPAAHEAIADFFYLATEGWSFFGHPVSAAAPFIGPTERLEPWAEPELETDAPSDTERVEPSRPAPEDARIYPVSSPGTKTGDRASRINVPDPPSLPHSLAFARALRPLSRRTPSDRFFEVDEEATVEQSARWQQLSLAVRPVRERRYDIVMVVEDSSSMALWKKTFDELERLLGAHGAFRDVHRVKLRVGADGIHLVLPGERRGDPRSLIDPSGRRLTLLFTHGADPAWHSENFKRVLLDWGAHQFVAIVQMLPPDHWEQTALGEPQAQARAPRAGLPNQGWLSTRPYLDELLFPGGAPVPIVPLTHDAFGQLAATIMAHASASVAAMHVSLAGSEDAAGLENHAPAGKSQPPTPLRPEALVARFLAHASPGAKHLAIALAACPLTLPVMRLVQQTIFAPGEIQQHQLVEVLLSGLMHRVQRAEDPDADTFRFFEGVPAVLAQYLSVQKRLAVRRQVFAYVRAHPEAAGVFPGLVPDQKGAEFIPFWETPFAEDYIDFQREILQPEEFENDRLGVIKSWIKSLGSPGQPPILIVVGARESKLPVRPLFLDVRHGQIVSIWVDLASLPPSPKEWEIAREIARAAGWVMDEAPHKREDMSRYSLDLGNWIEAKVRALSTRLMIALEFPGAPHHDHHFYVRNLLKQFVEIAISRPNAFSLALVDFPLGEIHVKDARLVKVTVLVPPSADADVARLRLLQRGHPSEWNDDHYWKLHNEPAYEVAEEYCRLILSADGSCKNARAYLTHLLGEHLGRILEAETMLREGIALDESDPNMHFNLAKLLVKLDRPVEALPEFDLAAVFVESKDLAVVRGRQADALVNLGRIDEAIKMFREAFEAHPDINAANSFVWALYRRNIRMDAAEEIGLRGYNLDPSEIHMLHTMAAIFVRRGKWSDAVPLLERWLKVVNIEKLKEKWYDFAPTFRDAFQTHRAAEMAELVIRANLSDPAWSAVVAALQTAGVAIDRSSLPIQLNETASELLRQFNGEIQELRFPGSPVAISGDH